MQLCVVPYPILVGGKFGRTSLVYSLKLVGSDYCN